MPPRHAHRPTRASLTVVTALAIVAVPAASRADVELSMHAGASTLELESSTETPLVGSKLDDAVDAYNGAALAYNRAHGHATGAPGAAPMSTGDDVGLAANLLVVTPALDVVMGPLRARLEVPVGFGDGLRTIGVGAYPLGLALRSRAAAAVPFVLAGGSVSHIVDGGRRGAVFELRVVLGVRVGRRLSVELGVRPYVAGGAVDRGRLDTLMREYDPRGAAAPPLPGAVVRGGVGQALDLTFGVSL